MRHDVSHTAQITDTQLQQHTARNSRLGCHCGIDSGFLTLHYSEKSKLKSFLFCTSASLCSSFPSTPVPLTLARGHPPVDGAIPAAFDTVFALQPTAISWFCWKSRENTTAFWVYCTAVTSSDCTEQSGLKDISETSRLIGNNEEKKKKGFEKEWKWMFCLVVFVRCRSLKMSDIFNGAVSYRVKRRHNFSLRTIIHPVSI